MVHDDENHHLNDREADEVKFSSASIKGRVEQRNKASFIFNPHQSDALLKDPIGGSSPNNALRADRSQVSTVQRESPLSNKGSSFEFSVPANLNQSSTRNVLLPNITRNESDLKSLKTKAVAVEQSQEMEPQFTPKILLLSLNKSKFTGLAIPSIDDEDTLRRENAQKIR